MQAYKSRLFHKWAAKAGITDDLLMLAAREIAAGLIDAELGGHVVKKRIGLHGRGKRGGMRTLVAFREAEKGFFIYGFAKNQHANISRQALKALRRLAGELLHYDQAALDRALEFGELIEVKDDG